MSLFSFKISKLKHIGSLLVCTIMCQSDGTFGHFFLFIFFAENGSNPDNLQYARVSIYDADECAVFNDTLPFNQRTMLCAGNETADACLVNTFRLCHLQSCFKSALKQNMMGSGTIVRVSNA